ncbi:sodium:solute symporter [Candidatus Neomarinimicrobiota bacterium]
MTIQLQPFDWALIFIYVLVLLVLGLASRGRQSRSENYLLGGRRLTLIPFVATLVSTWYGGILGIGEFAYSSGLVTILVFGVPYYFFAGLYAWLLTGPISSGNALTIPDRFLDRYGPRSRKFSALVVFLLTTPAPYLLMLGYLIHLLTGLDLWLTMLLGTIFSTIYVLQGGFNSVVRTDVFQFGLMFLGFAVLLYVLHTNLALGEMWERLPAGFRQWNGPDEMSGQVLVVWFLIAAWTFIDPGFYQRTVAARNRATARRGILISIGLWFVFDMLTTVCGLYAVIMLPDLVAEQGSAVGAFPLLGGQVLPVGLKGLFLVALLATIMSTVDSFSFLGATTIGRDLASSRSDDETAQTAKIRRGLIITGLAGYLLALWLPSVVELWFTIGTTLVPGLLIPMLISFVPAWSISDNDALLIGAVGIGIAAVWQLMPSVGVVAPGTYLLGLQPMLPGIAGSLTVAMVRLKYGR